MIPYQSTLRYKDGLNARTENKMIQINSGKAGIVLDIEKDTVEEVKVLEGTKMPQQSKKTANFGSNFLDMKTVTMVEYSEDYKLNINKLLRHHTLHDCNLYRSFNEV
jgi:hypothetical protein